MTLHDGRCEAGWNGQVCACAERLENLLRRDQPQLFRPKREGLLGKIVGLLALHK